MKTANLKFVKRNVASALLTTSFILLITAANGVMSTPLSISMIFEEKVTLTGMNPLSSCDSPLEGMITGIGTSSLLGQVSVEASNCITPVQDFFAFDQGKMVITDTSSGYEIFADFYGSFIPTSIPSIYTFTDSFFDITGGTGDFLGAKGGGKIQGGQSLLTGDGLIFATGKISHFKRDRDDDDNDSKKKDRGDEDDENDKDRKKKDKGDKEKDEDRTEKSKADQRITSNVYSNALTGGLSNMTMAADLDNGLFPHSQDLRQTLGDDSYQDKNARLLAINALPEAGSLTLLGVGLAVLVVARRRKSARKSY